MEVNFSELKCDYCSYRDTTVTFEQFKDSIDRPCPECGNSLLTEEDYNDCLKIIAVAKKVDQIGSVLKWFNPLHYFRLIFGIKQKEYNLSIEYPSKKNK